METKTFTVPNIGCSGCVNTVETTVRDIDGVKFVEADEATKVVSVQWEAPATWDKIVEALVEVEYPPAEIVNAN
ncbi:MAG: heavy-metal-associated domain-containing protein [Anaerolineae bacterium]|nr:heavy-metal-associated domain-containing protein [Anaerolineae bacterium]